MTFQLFGFDFSFEWNVFGFWIGGIESFDKEAARHLLAIYWDDGQLLVDLFFLNLIGY
jgi:hypothetical protein